MINQDQIKSIRERIEKIDKYLNISEKRIIYKEEELKSQDPDFWSDSKKAEIQIKKIRSIKYFLDAFDNLEELHNDLEVLFDFVK